MADKLTGGVPEFEALAHALSAYLEKTGWRAIVVGSPRIQQQPGDAEFNYEFVLRFTGGRKKNPAEPTAVAG